MRYQGQSAQRRGRGALLVHEQLAAVANLVVCGNVRTQCRQKRAAQCRSSSLRRRCRSRTGSPPCRSLQLQPQLEEVPAQLDQVEFVQSEGKRAHLSHTMKRMHGSEQVVYCSVCSYWQKTKKVTAALLAPCEAIKRSNWSKLRLLQCGVMPGPGARIPPGMARAKGTAREATGSTGRRSSLASPVL